jgi:hypothetical protein
MQHERPHIVFAFVIAAVIGALTWHFTHSRTMVVLAASVSAGLYDLLGRLKVAADSEALMARDIGARIGVFPLWMYCLVTVLFAVAWHLDWV